MRIFRLVATPILLLGLLGFLVWGALWGWRNVTAPLPSASPTPCLTVTPSTGLVTVNEMAVRVYNGGFQGGLAQRVSTQLRDAGMRVLRTGNTEERINGTVIRVNEGNVEARRIVASYFKDPVIEYDDRIDGTVDVLVGSNWTGFNEDPKTRLVQVSSGAEGACLPQSPTPSPTGTVTGSPSPSPSPTN